MMSWLLSTGGALGGRGGPAVLDFEGGERGNDTWVLGRGC